MSDNTPLFETVIIISPNERLKEGEYPQLPPHINVVDPFIASHEQANKLAARIAMPLRRNIFEISGLKDNGRSDKKLQRLGGAVLHNLHDEIIDAMERLKIVHDNVSWTDGTDQTLYSGTWQVPHSRVKVSSAHLAQELPETRGWQILKTYNFEVLPHADFRNDPTYIDSVINPVRRRGA